MFKKIIIISCSTLLLMTGIFFGIKAYTRYSIGYTKVCVASHNISQRTRISEEDLDYIEVPKAYLKDSIINKEDIVGKYVKLSYSIPKGSLIYSSCLENDIKDLAHTLLNENEVNYDLYISDIKINTASLGINMYIDLYLTINNHDKPVSDLLLSNARITGLYDSNSRLIKDYDNESRVYIISVAVNKENINILNKAQVLGSINCVINNNTYNENQRAMLNTESVLSDYLQ